MAFSVAKLAKLNLKGLTTLRSKKASARDTIAFFFIKGSRHQDQQNLSNHQCVWATLNSLEFSFHQMKIKRSP